MSDELWLSISMVARSVICERWFQLRMVDGIDNDGDVSIIRGHLAHENMPISRGVSTERFVFSNRMLVYGRCDILSNDGTMVIERKVGKSPSDSDFVQLALQAMCVEEELGIRLSCGTLQLFGSRRRVRVEFDDVLRSRAENAVMRCRELCSVSLVGITRMAVCRGCMLRDYCVTVSTHHGSYWETLLSEESVCV